MEDRDRELGQLENLLVVLLDSSDLSDRQIGFLYKISKLIPREKRFESLSRILNLTKSVFVPTRFVDLITQETEDYETANEYDRATGFLNGPLLAGEAVCGLSEICVEKIKKSEGEGSLEKERRLQYLLSFWKKFGHEKSVKDYVSKLLETEDGLFRFLESYIYCYAGIYISIDRNRALEQVGEVVDLNDLRERMNQIDVNGLGREKAGIIRFCHEFLQEIK